MNGADPTSSALCTPERFADRLAEAIRLGRDPEAFGRLPKWTQRVMLILKEQLVPPEFAMMVASDQAIFAEGVCVAWIAHARDIVGRKDSSESQFARDVARRITASAGGERVVTQVETAAVAHSAEFQEHVMRRLFSASAVERRAFAEGLAAGNRAYELFSRHAGERTTDATGIYLLLWLYWPEISAAGSIREAGEILAARFGANRNLAGRHWDERFRKLANRIGLSFRSKQDRKRRLANP